ncbi:MAG: ParB/RepB/Spo0J family partition protein [Rhizobiaceae bacterium]
MKLAHLDFDQLKPCDLNVRKKGKAEIADLLPSIRALGILQPLLVRPNCEGFEIVAGQRRYNAVAALREENILDPVPCIVMEDGDDAKAIEASLAENIARLPMDEIDQYKAFAALIAKGMTPEDIAAHFGVSERLVNQRLAIANIIDPILNAYRRQEIDAATLRILTMATAKQQKAWWKLFRSDDDYAPTGRALKAWLFGGSQVPVSNALFDVAGYSGAVISDLFGEDRYFADSEAFWTNQNAAITEAANRYREAGWSDVVILDVGDHFSTWNHQKTSKKKGGKVFVAISADGEVAFHEGWLSHKDVQQRVKAELRAAGNAPDAVPSAKPELTKPMLNYLTLHKHAAVRTELLAHSGLALRLAVAHMIAGSSLWKVEAEPQRAENEAIAQSLATSMAEAGFGAERTRIVRLLGLDVSGEEGDEPSTIARQRGEFGVRFNLSDLLERLAGMNDADVMRIMTFVMAETLAADATLVDTLGAHIGTDMKNWWTPNQTFFDLMRDKEAINAMLREVAGDITADAHKASTTKVQKKIVADCLTGEGRPKVESWLPRYMAFPAGGYTSRFAEAKPSTHMPLDDEDVG